MDYLDGSINFDLIDGSLLFKGSKGTYLNLQIVRCPGNKFNSHMILQKLSKDDIDFNIKLKENQGYNKADLIKPKVIGNLNIFSTESPLTLAEQAKYLQRLT
jgi:hypothetical protein